MIYIDLISILSLKALNIPFCVEGRPGRASRVLLFPSVLKEDLMGYPGWCNSLQVKEDQLSWVL
ncbi:hypothetical protein Taro_005068 [Colocasia esculenta]|uniref:Uncharacterized protein n=1 Tax=Colocasia esculenta TaxID=4460 RepID=A0A843TTI6_COLES|nr:hypothetical protein [Colocasia esculenta]